MSPLIPSYLPLPQIQRLPIDSMGRR